AGRWGDDLEWSTALPLSFGLRSLQFRMAKAANDVVIDHPDRLHEGVTDRGTDELEAPPFQVFAQGIRLGGRGRHVLQRLPGVLLGHALHELPEVLVERPKLLLNEQDSFGVLDSGSDLQAMADDPWIGQQSIHLLLAVAG